MPLPSHLDTCRPMPAYSHHIYLRGKKIHKNTLRTCWSLALSCLHLVVVDIPPSPLPHISQHRATAAPSTFDQYVSLAFHTTSQLSSSTHDNSLSTHTDFRLHVYRDSDNSRLYRRQSAIHPSGSGLALGAARALLHPIPSLGLKLLWTLPTCGGMGLCLVSTTEIWKGSPRLKLPVHHWTLRILRSAPPHSRSSFVSFIS